MKLRPKLGFHQTSQEPVETQFRVILRSGSQLCPPRKMMDSGQLDFYQHSTLCTNTCRSTKFDLLINNTRFPPDGTGLATPTSSLGERVGRRACGSHVISDGLRNGDL